MKDTIVVHQGQSGFLGILFIVFMVLKLTGVIGWSWWWVTAPLWGGMALALVVVLIALVIGLIGYIVDK